MEFAPCCGRSLGRADGQRQNDPENTENVKAKAGGHIDGHIDSNTLLIRHKYFITGIFQTLQDNTSERG